MPDTDSTLPNAARIYDWLLDGSHHAPADRAAGRVLLHIVPDAQQVTRLYRYFTEWSARALASHSFPAYLDLAAGLPPEGAIHELLPPTTKILYNDLDPEMVTLAHQQVAAYSNVQCRQGDLRDIAALLTDAAAWFAGERRVGIALVNVSWRLDDRALAHVFRQLYAWARPGSLLAVSGFALAGDDPLHQHVLAWYDHIHQPCFHRPAERLLALAAPWEVVGALAPIESYAEASLRRLQVDVLASPALAARRGRLGYAGLLRRP
jgi:hypothetical protein